MTAKATVAVVGPTGYTGRELTHLVVRHPSIDGSVFFLREGADGGGRTAGTAARGAHEFLRHRFRTRPGRKNGW
jgi:N-acetyl-gamma-glutamylphosphate reductase